MILKSVGMKENATVDRISMDGKFCALVEATDVVHLVCCQEGNEEKEFVICPKRMTCSVRVPVPAKFGMSGKTFMNFTVSLVQIPVIANAATTGHKLQGQTKESMVISVWSGRKNWNYVALSRVESRKGLFLISKLSHSTDFSIAPELRQMMSLLKRRCLTETDIDMQEETMISHQRLRARERNVRGRRN